MHVKKCSPNYSANEKKYIEFYGNLVFYYGNPEL